MTEKTPDLTLCGWRVRTAWPLPELLPWTGDDRAADITIRLGTVPEVLPGELRATPLVQVNDQGWVRYAIKGVAAYLIRNGSEIIIDTPHAPDTPDVALFLLGSGLGILCHQRGLLPLHASCVSFGDGAIAFTGPSGMGKSTIAARLLRENAHLVSDDITVIDVHAQGGPIALPTFPRQKLWRDTLDALALAPGRRVRSTVNLEKFERPVQESFRTTPVRLHTVFELRGRAKIESPLLAPVTGLMAVRMIHHNIYRNRAASMLGLGARMLGDSGQLSTVLRQHALFVPEGLKGAVLAESPLQAALGLSA